MDPISFLAGLITAFLSVLLAGWSYSRISRMPSPWGGYTVSTAPVVERDEEEEAMEAAIARAKRQDQRYKDEVAGLGV